MLSSASLDVRTSKSVPGSGLGAAVTLGNIDPDALGQANSEHNTYSDLPTE